MRLILRRKPPHSGPEREGGAKPKRPVLSSDGRFLLFDVFRPSGGDVWLLEGL
jgi:hypothetical protein